VEKRGHVLCTTPACHLLPCHSRLDIICRSAIQDATRMLEEERRMLPDLRVAGSNSTANLPAGGRVPRQLVALAKRCLRGGFRSGCLLPASCVRNPAACCRLLPEKRSASPVCQPLSATAHCWCWCGLAESQGGQLGCLNLCHSRLSHSACVSRYHVQLSAP
jgi:hypothetical protein